MSSPKRKSPEPSDTETKNIISIDISGCGPDVDGVFLPAEPGAFKEVLFTREDKLESCDIDDYHIWREDGGDLAIVIMPAGGGVIERLYETMAATMTIDDDDVEWRACGTRTGKPSLTFTYEEPPSKRRGDDDRDDHDDDGVDASKVAVSTARECSPDIDRRGDVAPTQAAPRAGMHSDESIRFALKSMAWPDDEIAVFLQVLKRSSEPPSKRRGDGVADADRDDDDGVDASKVAVSTAQECLDWVRQGTEEGKHRWA